MNKDLARRLNETPASRTAIRLSDWDRSEDVADEKTTVASYEAELPLRLREDRPPRLAFVHCEEFQVDGTEDNQETFELSEDIVDAPATESLVLFDDGDRVRPDSIDYDADEFDYTSPNSDTYLHAFYTVRAQNEITMEVTSPDAGGSSAHVVFDGVGTLIHEQDQNREPLNFSFDRPIEGFVPKKWTIDVYVEGPVAYSWDDTDEANSAGDSAPNAILTLPVTKSARDVPGLDQAVRRAISEPRG